VIDRATGEPVAGVSVAIEGDLALGPVQFPSLVPDSSRSAAVPVDGAGRFAFDAPLAAGATHVVVANPLQGTHIRSVKVAELVADPLGGSLARIAIGPTFRFAPIGVVRFEPDAFEARLVEIAADGVEHEGNWLRVQPASPPWLRYDNPWSPNAAGSRFRVDLRERDGSRAGSSAPLPGPAVGIHADVVPIALDRLQVRLTGRVLDAAGEPKQHVRVLAAPLEAGASSTPARRAHAVRTGADGRFEIAGLEVGTVQLTARPRRGEPPVTRRVVLDRAEVDVGDLLVATLVGVGAIRGRLESAAGRPLAGPEYVRLRAFDGRAIELFDVSLEGPHDRHGRTFDGRPFDGHHTFDFNEVPAGEFELSVVSQHGYRWLPQSLRVTASSDSAVFVRQDDVPLTAFAFQVVRADGRAVSRYEARITPANGPTSTVASAARGVELAILDELGPPGEFEPAAWIRGFHVPADQAFTWTVSAPGLRAASGDQADFSTRVHEDARTPSGEVLEFETRVATVELRPGFAARLRFRDYGAGHAHDDDAGLVHASEAPRIDGVRIRADGRAAGESSHGDAWIELDAEPRRLAFDAPGWRLVESDEFRNGRIVGPARDVVIWMVR
jgi:hypothetical protein